jgi:hypothetical protein
VRILVLVTGEYGHRHVENIKQRGPEAWEIEVWETPKILPPMVDYPEDYLPEELPPADLILSLAEVKGVAELIPDIAKMTGARSVIAPIDSQAWLPIGLARQLRGWLARMDVACVTPIPFCSLTPTHTNAMRLREPYEDALISEFAQYFGLPEFKAVVDEESQKIVKLEVVRDACCGCAHFVAEKLEGVDLDDAAEAAGLGHHHYPCQATMGIDPQFSDTLLHVSGNAMKDAVTNAIRPYHKVKRIKPHGRVED